MDIENLENLFKQWDISYEKEICNNYKIYDTDKIIKQVNIIEIDTDSNNVEGYCGFCTRFVFDSNGKFINIGLFE